MFFLRSKSKIWLRGELLLWLGLFASICWSSPRTANNVQVGALEVLKGVGPLSALIFFKLRSFRLSLESKIRSGQISRVLFYFGVLSLISAIWSENPMATILKSIQYLLVLSLCWEIAKLNSSISKTIIKINFIANFLIILGIIELVIFPDLAIPNSDQSSVSRFGIICPSISPNLVGVVVFVALIGNYLSLSIGIFKKPILQFFILGFGLIELYLSHSRIITIIFFIASLVAIFYRLRKSKVSRLKWINNFLLFFTFVFVCALAIYTDFISEFLLSYFTRGQNANGLSTLTGRTVVWSYALEAWQSKPVLGFGYYTGHRYTLGSSYSLLSNHSNLDNTWLEILVDLGLLGLVFMFGSVAKALFATLKGQFTPEVLMVRLFFYMVLILMFINPTIQTPSITLFFYTIIISSLTCQSERGVIGKASV